MDNWNGAGLIKGFSSITSVAGAEQWNPDRCRADRCEI